MLIRLEISPTYTQIIGLEDLSIIDKISKEISYHDSNYKYSPAYRYGGWDGLHRLLTKNLKFPVGLLERVCKVLYVNEIEFQVINRIKYPAIEVPIVWAGPILYEYQNEVVEKLLTSKDHRALVRVGTGGGKSIIISKLVAEMNIKTNILVISLDLMSQMKETLESCLNVKVGQIGGGVCDIKKINIVSIYSAGLAFGQKNLEKSEDDEECWDPPSIQKEEIRSAIQDAELCIMDEVHYCSSNLVQTIMNNSTSAAYRFGFSGTPWKSGGENLLIEAAFGNKICDISASYLINNGYLVEPKILFKDIKEHDKKIPKNWNATKSSYIVNNDFRNNLLIDSCLKLLNQGRRPLMLFREIPHGKKLLSMIPDDVKVKMVNGSMSGPDRDQVRADFKNGKIDLLIASTIFDCGIDLSTIDAMVLTSGGKSTSRACQRIGRAIRTYPGKTDALIVETYDQAHYVKDHSIARYNIYKTEPRFKIKTEQAMTSVLSRKKNG